MTKVRNLIIFGDSMTDIGIKKGSVYGVLGRALRQMRVNEIGRFSDRKNWTDFLWEWSGGETMIMKDKDTTNKLSNNHKNFGWTDKNGSRAGSIVGSPLDSNERFLYINYAEGGAMGASDRGKMGLYSFKHQVDNYLKLERGRSEETLYIIWFGLNDLITNNRPKNEMLGVVKELLGLCKQIQDKTDGFFLILNLPDPKDAVRFELLQTTQEIKDFQEGAENYNKCLTEEIVKPEWSFKANTIKLVDINADLKLVNADLASYGLRKGAQPRGIKVRYYSQRPYEAGMLVLLNIKDSLGETFQVRASSMSHDLENQHLAVYERTNPNARLTRIAQMEIMRKEIRAGSSDEVIYAAAKLVRDKAAEDTGFFGRSDLRDTLDRFLDKDIYADFADFNSNWTTTSDGAHPTEAVYKIIAKSIVKTIKANNLEIGRLNQSKEANWVFPAVQKGKCPGCKKSGHDTDATYCKYCGSRFPQY